MFGVGEKKVRIVCPGRSRQRVRRFAAVHCRGGGGEHSSWQPAATAAYTVTAASRMVCGPTWGFFLFVFA